MLDEYTLHVLHHHNVLVDVFTRDGVAIILHCNPYQLIESLNFLVFHGNLLLVVVTNFIVCGIINLPFDRHLVDYNVTDFLLHLLEGHHGVLSLWLRLSDLFQLEQIVNFVITPHKILLVYFCQFFFIGPCHEIHDSSVSRKDFFDSVVNVFIKHGALTLDLLVFQQPCEQADM